MERFANGVLAYFVVVSHIVHVAAYSASPLHMVERHFRPNRCGDAAYACCNEKIQCTNKTQEQGSCRQDHATANWCQTFECTPACTNGYFCQHNNLCVKVNDTLSTYEQVDFTCPSAHWGRKYEWGRGESKWKNNKVYACQYCEWGKYSPSTNNDTKCRDCPAGEKAISGRRECQVCAEGRVSYAGSEYCWHKQCPAGSYHDGGEKTCTKCKAGTYNPKNGAEGQNECIPCAAGTVLDWRGASSVGHCQACPAGTASPVEGVATWEACKECPTGLKSGPAYSECFGACQPGLKTTGVPNICEQCPKGQYNGDFEQAACKKCPAGKVYNGYQGTSINVCQNCTAGKVQSKTGQHSCGNCPTGKWSAPGSAECKLCATGRYGDYQGMESPEECKECDTGMYNSLPGQSLPSACLNCKPGMYNTLEGAESCTNCPAGTYNALEGKRVQTDCLNCDSSNRSPPGADECGVLCPAGTFPTSGEASQCSLCPAGRAGGDVSLTDANAACIPCNPGNFSSAGVAACSVCDRGKFSLGSAAECSACPGGKYGPIPGASNISDCVDCPITTFSRDGEGLPECTRCPKGRYSPRKATSCTRCAAGKARQDSIVIKSFYNFPDNTAWGHSMYQQYLPFLSIPEMQSDWTNWKVIANHHSEPEGINSNNIGARFTGTFKILKSGSYKFQTRSDDMSFMYKDENMIVNNGGYHGMVTKSSEAIVLTKGAKASFTVTWFQGKGGYGLETKMQYESNGWTSFPDDEYLGEAAFNETNECTLCQSGYFAEEAGMAVCQPCGNGTYQSAAGATSCEQCVPGLFSVIPGMTHADNCTKCPMGSSNAKYGFGMECPPCMEGTYSDAEGLIKCKNCPGGKVSSVFASESIEFCEMCPSGHSATAGSSECQICVPGKVAPSEGMTDCDLCQAGKYSKEGKEDCFDCRPGSYSKYNMSLPMPCKSCPFGKFSMVSGATDCRDCPRNTYARISGKRECSPCTGPSWTNNAEASTTCEPCQVGQVFPYKNATGGNCEKCMSGRYSLIAGESFPGCHSCPVGAVCNGGNHLQILPGFYLNKGCNKTSGKCGDIQDMPRQCDVAHKDCGGELCECYQKDKWRGHYYDLCGMKRMITRCPAAHFCRGNGTCRKGHTGPLCLLCEAGWFMSGGQCESCDISTPASSSRVIVIVLIGLIVTIALTYFVAKRFKSFKKYSVVTKDIMRMMKIMVFHLQICQGLQSIYPIDWGDSLTSFFGMFAPLNMDLLDVTSVGCNVTLNYYMSYVFVVVLMPLTIVGLVYLWYRLRVKFIQSELHAEDVKRIKEETEAAEVQKKNISAAQRFKRASMTVKKMNKEQFRVATSAKVKEMKLGNMAITVVFQAACIIHTPIARKTFEFTNCVDVGDCEYFLKVDPKIRCYTTEWWIFFGLVSLIGIFFVIGLPGGLWYILWKKKKIVYGGDEGSGKSGLDAPNIIERFGFTYLPYRSNAYFWESEEMFRKMILSGALVYLSQTPSLQCAVALCACLFFHVMHTAYQPHVSKSVYEIQHMLLFVAFVTFLVGLLSLSQTENKAQEDAIKMTLLVVHVGVVLVVIVALFYSACHAMKKIHSINKESKKTKSLTAVVPIPPPRRSKDEDTNALVEARKKFGASSPEYRKALADYKAWQKSKMGAHPARRSGAKGPGQKRRASPQK